MYAKPVKFKKSGAAKFDALPRPSGRTHGQTDVAHDTVPNALYHSTVLLNRVGRPIVIFAAILAGFYLACCALLFVMQRSMIFAAPRNYAAQSAAHAEKSLALAVDGARVRVSTRVVPGPNAVIYFGGNGEDVADNIPQLERAFPTSAVYALHYRGYTGSSGSPSETAIIADALILYDRVKAEHADVTLVGRSLGSGVAIHVASVRQVRRLVLVTPYDSLEKIAARRFPFFPVRWLLLDKFESWRYAPRVTAPTVLIAAEYDTVIPRASTDSLYRHLPDGLATLIVVPDASHSTISETTEYTALLRGPP